MARFARAQSRGLISAAEVAAVTGTAGSFTPARVIFDTGPEETTGRDRTVLGPFETSSQALRRCGQTTGRSSALSPGPTC